jgi:hypothetical protein
VTKLALQPDGKVLASNKGGVEGQYPTIALSRFLPDGSKDPSFRFSLPTNSINSGIWSGFWTTALAVRPDGKILLAGHYERDHFDYWYWSAVSLQRLSFSNPGHQDYAVLKSKTPPCPSRPGQCWAHRQTSAAICINLQMISPHPKPSPSIDCNGWPRDKLASNRTRLILSSVSFCKCRTLFA